MRKDKVTDPPAELAPPRLWRLSCTAKGCDAQICGVGGTIGAVASGWTGIYDGGGPSRALCPKHHASGLAQAAKDARAYQATLAVSAGVGALVSEEGPMAAFRKLLG